MFQKRRFKAIWLSICAVAALLGVFAAGLFHINQPTEAVAAGSSGIKLYDEVTEKFIWNNLESLAVAAGYAPDSANKKDAIDVLIESVQKGATKDAQSFPAGTLINLGSYVHNGRMGDGKKYDFEWIPTYLSKDDSGNVILTLWQSEMVEPGGITNGTKNSEFGPYTKNGYYCSDYGTSYLRAVTFNMGGTYEHNWGQVFNANYQGAQPSYYPNQTSDKKLNYYVDFTTGALKDYMVVPNNVSWQKSENKYKNDLSNTTTGYSNAWGNDNIWLPSLTEVGDNRSGNMTFADNVAANLVRGGGIWNTTFDMMEGYGYWHTTDSANYAGWLGLTRSAVGAPFSESVGADMYASTVYTLCDQGQGYRNVANRNQSVRPALHLNLTRALANSVVQVKAPTVTTTSVDYDPDNDAEFTLNNYNATANRGTKTSDNITVTLPASPAGMTNDDGVLKARPAGTYTVKIQPKSGYIWSDYTTKAGSTEERTITVTINRKKVKVPYLASYSADYNGSD
ncbi:MAG: hypothetical protein K2H43_06055, partial [Clostridia bacterium]|nr:hypothetical protein [Clostridia bacterium]